MNRIWQFLLRIKNRHRDLADEIQTHLTMAQRDLEERGLAPAIAERQAIREFGNRTLVAEVTRQVSRGQIFERFWQDVRYGLSTMRRSLAFTIVAVLSLALGIGANTAIFTLINAIMLQWLPVQDPAHLVLFYDGPDGGIYSGSEEFPSDIFSYPSWQYLRSQALPFEDFCAFRQTTDRVALRLPDAAPGSLNEQAQIHLVSGNYFSVLGVQPACGRVFRMPDDSVNAPATAVISYRFWKNRFALDPNVVGKTVLLSKMPFTIVGIAAREFFGEHIDTAPDFWLPLSFQPQILQRESLLTDHESYWLDFMARLKPSVSVKQAEATVTKHLQDFYFAQAGSHPSTSILRKLRSVQVVLHPGGAGISNLRYRYSEPLHLLMAVVGVVLLIACANLATLLLARASARQNEFLTRVALGASPARIVRQVLTESLLLSIFGGLAGIAFAWWMLKGLTFLLQANPVVKVHIDPFVLAFTLTVTALTALLFGFIPALRFSAMEAKSRTMPHSSSRAATPSFLIVLQIALSFVLLLGTALLTRSLVALQSQDKGFHAANLLLVHTDVKLAGYQEKNLLPLYRTLDTRLNQIPGVISASLARYTPVSNSVSSGAFAIEGYIPQGSQKMDLYRVEVGPRFLNTLGTPLLLGRDIGPGDLPDSTPVAVVNTTFVKTYFPHENPLGKKFSFGYSFNPPGFEIVGVAGDSKYYTLREDPKPMAFVSAWQFKGDSIYAGDLLIRTAQSPMAIAPEVRRVLNNTDRALPVIRITTLDKQLDNSLRQQKFLMDLCSAFGFAALLLTAIGIYGTVAYSVSRRTMEIGIRMAIGAQREHVLWMIVRESLTLTVIGLCVGFPLAIVAVRSIKSFLFGVPAADPLALASAILLVSAGALTAGYLPAARASKIDPMAALKYE